VTGARTWQIPLLNTGHSGTISTVHANSAAQGISRFTTCVLQGGVELPYRAIKTNIADSLNIIVQIQRRPGTRFVSEVLEIQGYDAEAGPIQSPPNLHTAPRSVRNWSRIESLLPWDLVQDVR
jgi:pilus assembly protein CpaF